MTRLISVRSLLNTFTPVTKSQFAATPPGCLPLWMMLPSHKPSQLSANKTAFNLYGLSKLSFQLKLQKISANRKVRRQLCSSAIRPFHCDGFGINYFSVCNRERLYGFWLYWCEYWIELAPGRRSTLYARHNAQPHSRHSNNISTIRRMKSK